jgi:hypothetical protein
MALTPRIDFTWLSLGESERKKKDQKSKIKKSMGA